jgi:hypothetical protein
MARHRAIRSSNFQSEFGRERERERKKERERERKRVHVIRILLQYLLENISKSSSDGILLFCLTDIDDDDEYGVSPSPNLSTSMGSLLFIFSALASLKDPFHFQKNIFIPIVDLRQAR